MAKEDIKKLIKTIGECSSIEEARSKLVDLETEVDKDYDEHEKTKTELQKANEDKETLRQANMDLFLKTKANSDEPGTDGKGKDSDPGNEDLKYDDLFNDDGTIK